METVYSPVNVDERRKIDMRAGDTVRVWQKIEEKGKTRLQAFEGLLIARKHGTEPGATFTIRKIASGVGVEKIFPLYSPIIDRIEIVRRAKVRRSKLYYIREKSAREIRKKMKSLSAFIPRDYKEEKPVTQEELDAQAEEGKEQTTTTPSQEENTAVSTEASETSEPKEEVESADETSQNGTEEATAEPPQSEETPQEETKETVAEEKQ